MSRLLGHANASASGERSTPNSRQHLMDVASRPRAGRCRPVRQAQHFCRRSRVRESLRWIDRKIRGPGTSEFRSSDLALFHIFQGCLSHDISPVAPGSERGHVWRSINNPLVPRRGALSSVDLSAKNRNGLLIDRSRIQCLEGSEVSFARLSTRAITRVLISAEYASPSVGFPKQSMLIEPAIKPRQVNPFDLIRSEHALARSVQRGLPRRNG